MTKEEILLKSRNENQDKDIADLEVQKKAAFVGYFATFFICVLISVINFVITGKISVQCWVVFFGMLSVSFFTKFVKLRKLHELFVSISYFAIFILLIIRMVFELGLK